MAATTDLIRALEDVIQKAWRLRSHVLLPDVSTANVIRGDTARFDTAVRQAREVVLRVRAKEKVDREAKAEGLPPVA